MGRYQKCKTKPDFTKARDSEWQWHQLGYMQDCTSLQTDNQTSTPPLRFLQAGCPSCRPTNSVKALKAIEEISKEIKNQIKGTLRPGACTRQADTTCCLVRIMLFTEAGAQCDKLTSCQSNVDCHSIVNLIYQQQWPVYHRHQASI